MSKEQIATIKVSKRTQAAVRYGAALFAETQQAFLDRAVQAFFTQNAAEVDERGKAIRSGLLRNTR